MTDHTDGWMLAIDFGTSNTAAAIRSGARNEVLELSRGSRTMPSGVIIDINDGPRVGEMAERLRALHPHEYEENPKSLVGMVPQSYGGRPVHAEEFVAEIFREIKRIALDRMAGVEPTKVILTHPSAWGGVKTQQLRRAAERAGFDPRTVVLLEEPIAAAHYFRHESLGQPIPIGKQVLVFDFGGGTLDLALVEHAEDGEFEVKDIEATENLGGKDFDTALWDWTLAQLGRTHPEAVAHLNSPNGHREKATLRDFVRRAKEDLSFRPATEIPVIIAGYDETYRPTAEEYEALIRPLVDRAVALTKTLLDRNDGSKVVQFYLTGGTSLTPLVARALAEATGIIPTRLGDPKTVVVDGALSAVAATAPAPIPEKPAPPDFPDKPVTSAAPDFSEKPVNGTNETHELLPDPAPAAPHAKRISVISAFIGAGLFALLGISFLPFVPPSAVVHENAYLLEASAVAFLLTHHLTRPLKDGRVPAFIYGLSIALLIVLYFLTGGDIAYLFDTLVLIYGGCLVFVGVWLLNTARQRNGPYVRSLKAPAVWVIVAGATFMLYIAIFYVGSATVELVFTWQESFFLWFAWVWPLIYLGMATGYVISAIRLKGELKNDSMITHPNVADHVAAPRA